MRGLLTEFGLVFPQGPDALLRQLDDTLEDGSNELPGIARLALQRAHLHWLEIECQLASCDQQIDLHARHDEPASAIVRIPGIGPVTARALVASVGDFRQLASASQFGSWLGLVAAQDSSGGKTRLGRITKQGDTYLRTMLIQAAKSAVMTAHKRRDRISAWVVPLKDRVGWQKAVVALANQHARIVWALLARGRAFDPEHISVYPAAPPAAVATAG